MFNRVTPYEAPLALGFLQLGRHSSRPRILILLRPLSRPLLFDANPCMEEVCRWKTDEPQLLHRSVPMTCYSSSSHEHEIHEASLRDLDKFLLNCLLIDHINVAFENAAQKGVDQTSIQETTSAHLTIRRHQCTVYEPNFSVTSFCVLIRLRTTNSQLKYPA